MQEKDNIVLKVTLDRQCAYELAKYMNRATFPRFFMATDEGLSFEERSELARCMLRANTAVLRGLLKAGIDPHELPPRR